jgi:predicted nuclease of predicted toxin-antitoxin system
MPGKFKLDENVPSDAAQLLAVAGHDVETVLSENLGGEPDRKVIDIARAEDRILVTLDLDFADTREYPPNEYPGIWVLRSQSQAIESTLSLLRGALAILDSESPSHRLWIVETGRVRIHE